MNASLMTLEFWVTALGIVLLLADFFFGVTPQRKKALAWLGIAALGVMFLTLLGNDAPTGTAFNGAFVEDPLAIFFKRFFLVAAILVLFMTSEFSEKISASVSEYYSLVIFALTGMLFAASSNDFAMLFVSIELITVTFYVLVSYQRRKLLSLEAGVKYLIIGALSSAFMVFGIALIWGTTGEINFTKLAAVAPQYLNFSGGCFVSVDRAWVQDLRGSISNLGAGRLSGRADSDQCLSGRGLESRRLRPPAARFVHRGSRRRSSLEQFSHCYIRPDHSLW
jgi:NADH:ubiquinone oxidoreductase subunit 2 (subunit N)